MKQSRSSRILRRITYTFVGLYVLGAIIAFRPFPGRRVDNELEKYEKEYKQLLLENCPKIQYNHYDMTFADLPSRGAGLCLDYRVKFVIYVDREYWKENSSETERRALLYHEMSHCFLKLDHVKSIRDYMYFETNNISDEVLLIQVKRDITEACKRL